MNVRLVRTIFSMAVGIAIFFALNITEAAAKLQIVTSFSEDSSIAEAIGGDRVIVTSLTTGVQDPHAVEPKPSLVLSLSQADLLIVNGQQMEIAWLPEAVAASGNDRIQEGKEGYLNASNGVILLAYTNLEIKNTKFMSATKDGAPKAANHHYWLDPENGLIIADNIYRKLSQLDAANAGYYKTNYEAFTSRLSGKIKDWDAMMEPFRGTKIVSYHRDWTYLANRHGFDIIDYIEPRETIPPSARDVAVLIKRIRDEKVRLILISPWQPQRISHEIARQSGAAILSLPSAVDPRLGTKDYINMFDVIYSQLAKIFTE